MRNIFGLILIGCTPEKEDGPANSKPQVSITSHSDGDSVREGIPTLLSGKVSDLNDTLSSLKATWAVDGVELCTDISPEDGGVVHCLTSFETTHQQISLSVVDSRLSMGESHVGIFVIPNIPPEVTILAPDSQGSYYSGHPIEFIAEVSDTEDTVDMLVGEWSSDLDGVLDIGFTPSNTGLVESQGTLSEGTHTIQLAVIDSTEKMSYSQVVLNIGPANSDPNCEILSPSINTATPVGTDILLSGLATDNDVSSEVLMGAWYSDKDGLLNEQSPNEDGRLSFITSNLSINTHTLTLSVSDDVGGTCVSSMEHTVGTAPSLIINSPLDNEVFSEGSVLEFSLLVDDPEEAPENITLNWLLNGNLISTDSPTISGTASFTPGPLPYGEYLLEVRATDSVGLLTSEELIFVINGLPSENIFSIIPTPANTLSTLAIDLLTPSLDPEGNIITTQIVWLKDGQVQGNQNSYSIPPLATSKGEQWTAQLISNDGITDGPMSEATSIIENTVPSIDHIAISPATDVTNDLILTCSASISDPDETPSSTYEWSVDGSNIGLGNSIDLSTLSVYPEDVVVCSVVATDADNAQTTADANVSITNRAPRIKGITLSPASNLSSQDLVTCQADVQDDDGEILTPIYTWVIGSNTYNGDALQLSPSMLSPGDEIFCNVSIEDSYGETDTQSEGAVISNTPPEITASITTSDSSNYGMWFCDTIASDVDDFPESPGITISWTDDNGLLIGNTNPLQLSSSIGIDGDLIRCEATATDLFGESTTSHAQMSITNAIPIVTAAELTPSLPRAESPVIACSITSFDNDGDPVDIRFDWRIDGLLQNTITDSLEGPFLFGQEISCQATPNDGKSDGQTIEQTTTIENTPPNVTTITIHPAVIYTNDLLTVDFGYSEVDVGQSVSGHFEWHVINSDTGNDLIVQNDTTQTLSGLSFFNKGDSVYVNVVPFDGISNGQETSSDILVVQNSQPSPAQINLAPQNGSRLDDLICTITQEGSDADGDPLSHQFEWIDPNGLIATGTTVGDMSYIEGPLIAGPWTCRLSTSDGQHSVTESQSSIVYDDCSFELTQWSDISTELTGMQEYLPTLPDDLLATNWEDPTPEFMFHTIEASERGSEVPHSQSCDLPSFWDDDRVKMGPYIESPNPYCRVNIASTPLDDTGLYALSKYIHNYHVPITGEPAWVRYRFPIPDGHEARKLTYYVNRARLFGSNPENCHPNEQDTNGDCTLAALDPNETWEPDIPAGLFILWGEAGGCNGWTITGPHDPIETFSYSSPERYLVEVPESIQDVEELVVSFLVYHQYPGGCEGTYCSSAIGTSSVIGFHDMSLLTEMPFETQSSPPLEHPRLFGDNTAWMTEQQAFENLDCLSTDWPVNSGWGNLTNIPNVWDENTKGGSKCLGTIPSSIVDIDFANSYLDGSAANSLIYTNIAKAIHLVRRERACQETNIGTCWFDSQEIEDLAQAIIDIEIERLPTVTFSTFGFEFDLRTREPLRVYTLFADTLWDDLSPGEHQILQDTFDPQIDGYLNHFDEQHWAVFNGNNWTPVLAEGALYWAITYYHEDTRAPEVAKLALYSLWLHRNAYLDDGVYYEGLLMYSQVSFDPIITTARMAKASFGINTFSTDWEKMNLFSQWALAFMGPDGYTIDFSDSWPVKGWGSFMPLLAHMTNPVTGDIDLDPDPCFSAEFFNNKYYYHGLSDPWYIHPALAQDWASILAACPTNDPLPNGIELNTWETGGWGSIRIGLPNSTTLGSSQDPISRFHQMDQVMLAMSAIPNTYPHTELDFGTVVWIAYGNRLLKDFGYGTISSLQYQINPDYLTFDNNPVGHNTLVIPEALENGDPSTNTSQIDGEVGTISHYTLGDTEIMVADGSDVYGQSNSELGWLSFFERSIFGLEEGHIIIIDSIMARSDRGLISPEEYWITETYNPLSTSDCGTNYTGLERIIETESVTFLPSCSHLDRYELAESAGRMIGTSLSGGYFRDLGEVSLYNRLGNLDTKSRFSWTPNYPIEMDLRLFVLAAETSEAALPVGEWNWVNCESDICASLSLDGFERIEMRFNDDGNAYRLLDIIEF